MISLKKYNLIVLAILGLLLDLLSTYYCSGATLKYEGNPFFLKYKFGWLGLIVLLSTFCMFDILLFIYHKWIYKNIDYSNEKPFRAIQVPMLYIFGIANYEIFFKHIFYYKTSFKIFKTAFYSSLNYFGFYNIRIYIITHIPLIINNFLLGIIYNNARIDIDNTNKLTTININKSWVWDTILGNVAIWYFSLGQERNQFIMSCIYYLSTLLIFILFVVREYKRAGIKANLYLV